MSLQLGARYYADGPEGHANWGARLNLTFLFPQKHAAPTPVAGK